MRTYALFFHAFLSGGHRIASSVFSLSFLSPCCRPVARKVELRHVMLRFIPRRRDTRLNGAHSSCPRAVCVFLAIRCTQTDSVLFSRAPPSLPPKTYKSWSCMHIHTPRTCAVISLSLSHVHLLWPPEPASASQLIGRLGVAALPARPRTHNSLHVCLYTIPSSSCRTDRWGTFVRTPRSV